MPTFEKGAWYWLESEAEGFLPVKLSKEVGDDMVGVSAQGEQFSFKSAKEMARVNESSLTAVENMVEMEELSEAAILHNLRMRFDEDVIYTYISSILVSMNPFKMLPIYSPAIMQEYRDTLNAGLPMAPHAYAIAHETYKALTAEGNNQSVIISGESGAGKTEATKQVLQYMAEMSGQHSDVEQQLLQSNPIIESFGNAKTARNDNSSRFGKWIAITFNAKFHIHGARITNYLLEKSRIVQPGQTERNYHAFYQLIAGADAATTKKFFLEDARTFKILAAGGVVSVPGIDDKKEYEEANEAMDVLQFSPEEQEDVWRTTAACMHLGNIEMSQDSRDKSFIKDKDPVKKAANLLGVSADTLEKSLTSQSKMMGREKVLTVLNEVKANANLLALTKTVFAKMFDWIIIRVNKTMFKEIDRFSLVGVLDIFGFEIFEDNRFEQFCINFANEKMQQHFNEHIFAMEQEEYKKDKIDVANVEFVDNQECLDTIEKGRQCILGMTDEEIKLPKGSDQNLLDRMGDQFKNSKFFTLDKTRKPEFAIVHYAGPVTYQIGGFMEKNKDALGVDAVDCVRSSTYAFISTLVPPADKKSVTVGSQFKKQLGSLMTTLKSTEPHFIRCIKSNNQKVSDVFDSPMVLRQLRYLGLKEVVNIRQLGYPVRKLHQQFFNRYGLLIGGASSGDAKVDCATLLNKLEIPDTEWRIGDTKCFIRNKVQKTLEMKRDEELKGLVIELQSLARAKVFRTRFLKVNKAADNLREAVKTAKTPAELDLAIDAYENLQMNLQPELLKEAIELRNLMHKRNSALKALKSAVKQKSRETLVKAIAKVKEAFADCADANGPVAEAQALLDKIILLRTTQEEGFEKRDIETVKKAVQIAEELELNGVTEQQAVALVTKLEEENKIKANMKDAMKNKDIEALKKTLAVAMQLESGAMVGSALERALAAGLADDPIVMEALEAVKTMETEIAVYKLAEELDGAIKTNDKAIIMATLKAAEDQDMGSLPQCEAARTAIAKLEVEEALIAKLGKAIEARAMKPLEACIKEVQAAGLSDHPTCVSALVTVNEIKTVLRELEQAQKRAVIEKAAAAGRAKMEKKAREAAEEKAKQQALEQKRVRAQQKADAEAAQLAAEEAKAEAAAALAKAAAEGDEKAKAEAEAKAAALEEEEKKIAEDKVRLEAEAKAAEEKEEARMAASAEDNKKKDEDVSKQAAQEQKNLDEKLAKAKALGIRGDDNLDKANAEAQTKEQQEKCINSLKSAIENKNLEQLKDGIAKAKELQIASTDPTLKTSFSLMNELQDELEARERDLREAEKQQNDDEDFLPPPPDDDEKDDGSEGMDLFVNKTFRDLKFRWTQFVHLRDTNDFAEGKMFQKKALKKGMFKHTTSPIPKSLTTLQKNDDAEASQAFKSVQGFMGDRHYSFPDALLAELIDNLCKFKTLRNEVYIQAMKQLTNNPKPASELQGWMLLALLAEHVPPQKNLLPYVLKFIDDHIEGPYSPQIVDYATYTMKVIQNTWKKWAVPKYKPKPGSIDHVTTFRSRTMKAGNCWVQFPDGSETQIFVQPWEPNRLLIPKLCESIGMTCMNGICIMEMKNGLQSAILEDECLLDFQHRWDLASQEEKKEEKIVKKKRAFYLPRKKANASAVGEGKGDCCRFVLCRQLVTLPPVSTRDPVMRKLFYAQHAKDLMMGVQKVTRETAIKLAAMAKTIDKNFSKIGQLIAERPLANGEKAPMDAYGGRKNWEIPSTLLKKKSNPEVFDKAVDALCANDATVKAITVDSYLNLVTQRPLFCAQYFRVGNSTGHLRYPPLVDLAINHHGLFVLNTGNREELDHWQLLQIMGWSHTPIKIKLKVKLSRKVAGKSNETLQFLTSDNKAMGKEICALLLLYASEMMKAIQAKKAKAKRRV